jgi:hypothetical protein
MTVLSWPPNRKPPRARPARKVIVDPLPLATLEAFADIPGPRDETPEQKAARLEANKAEILSFNPRNAAEAMLASHTILMRALAGDTKREAASQPKGSSRGNQFLRLLKQFDKQAEETLRHLEHQQSRPLAKIDPAFFRALGLTPEVIPDPDDPAQLDQAVSAIIVPLHPAPKMLQ